MPLALALALAPALTLTPYALPPATRAGLLLRAPCWQAYCEALQAGGLIASVAEDDD